MQDRYNHAAVEKIAQDQWESTKAYKTVEKMCIRDRHTPVSGFAFIDPFSIRIPEVFHLTRFFTADAPIIFSGIFRNARK